MLQQKEAKELAFVTCPKAWAWGLDSQVLTPLTVVAVVAHGVAHATFCEEPHDVAHASLKVLVLVGTQALPLQVQPSQFHFQVLLGGRWQAHLLNHVRDSSVPEVELESCLVLVLLPWSRDLSQESESYSFLLGFGRRNWEDSSCGMAPLVVVEASCSLETSCLVAAGEEVLVPSLAAVQTVAPSGVAAMEVL